MVSNKKRVVMACTAGCPLESERVASNKKRVVMVWLVGSP